MSWNSEENESEEKNQEKSGVLSVKCKRSTEADESKVLKSTGRGKGLLQK
jgi:hypothetical protein